MTARPIPTAQLRVNVVYTDGEEDSFGFASEENAVVFRDRQARNPSVASVKLLDPRKTYCQSTAERR